MMGFFSAMRNEMIKSCFTEYYQRHNNCDYTLIKLRAQSVDYRTTRL